jgi:hypothetical protein
MVKDGNIMLIDVGNAFVTIKINKEEIIEMKCDTCLHPATYFNDRRDLFRFLLDLGFPNSKISIKLNEFIRYLITEKDAKQFKLKNKKATQDFVDVLYNDVLYNDKYGDELCLDFKPKNIIKLFENFNKNLQMPPVSVEPKAVIQPPALSVIQPPPPALSPPVHKQYCCGIMFKSSKKSSSKKSSSKKSLPKKSLPKKSSKKKPKKSSSKKSSSKKSSSKKSSSKKSSSKKSSSKSRLKRRLKVA